MTVQGARRRTVLRFGRFRFEPDSGWRVAGASFTLDHVRLSEFRLVDEAPEGAEWRERIEAIDGSSGPANDRAAWMSKVRARPPLQSAVLRTDPYNDRSLTLEAYATYGNVGVVFTLLGTVGATEMMLDVVHGVAGAYRSSVAVRTDLRPNEFRTRFGAIDRGDVRMEDAYVRLVHDASSSELELESSLLTVSGHRSMIEAWEQQLREWPTLAQSISGLRADERAVAGLQGEELVFAVIEAERKTWQMAWVFGGAARDPYRPRLSVALEARTMRDADALGLWDDLVSTIRRSPP